MKIKTRFAPSPTGYLHIGSIHTALYAWLFAKSQNGKFLLRIEDTDIKRSTKLTIQYILDSMNWLNLNWDEGPYFQANRIHRYNDIANRMLNSGYAYKCYCSKERLKNLRQNQIKENKKPRYDGYCLLNNDLNKKDLPYVIRFKNPAFGKITFYDLIRGKIEFNNNELDDLIIRRVDGSFTYNFCVIVDDYDMKITHIIRGDEHINNTPRQINILKSIGAPIPIYAHVPTIIGVNGKKLSKRYGESGIMYYRDAGFLPEAICNYLIRMGWSYGNKEIFNLEEMIKLFNINKVSKSKSIFDIKKLLWYNQYYIKNLPTKQLSKYLKCYLEKNNINVNLDSKLENLVKLFSKSCKTLKEIALNCRYFYHDFNIFDLDFVDKYLSEITLNQFTIMLQKLKNIINWEPNNISTAIKETSKQLNLNLFQVCMPLRIAIIGSEKSPAINTIMYIIGKYYCLKRINNAIEYINNQKK